MDHVLHVHCSGTCTELWLGVACYGVIPEQMVNNQGEGSCQTERAPVVILWDSKGNRFHWAKQSVALEEAETKSLVQESG